MSSIVLELQAEAMNSSCNITNLLRKAHVIAVKLKLTEFDEWINNELNGYKDKKSIPDYRLVGGGKLKALNPCGEWIPVIMDNNAVNSTICDRRMGNPVINILELIKKDTASIQIPPETASLLSRFTNFTTKYVIFFSTIQFTTILDAVRNTVLDWTLKLEEQGVLGERLIFSEKEKEVAHNRTQTFNTYYAPTTNITGNVSQSNIVTAENNNHSFNCTEALKMVEEIKNQIETEIINPEDKSEAVELLDEISNKISANKKPNIVKSALNGLKDFLLSIGAGLTVAVIDAKIKGLF